MMNYFFLGLLFTTLSLLPASAATIIFDNTSAHPGGTLTFGTALAPGSVTLTSGVIDLVTKIDGSITSFGVTGSCGIGSAYGCMNMTTGSFIDQFTVGNTTTYRYNGGGSFCIRGSADGASGLLLSTAGFDGIVTLNVNNPTQLASLSGTLAPGVLNSVLASSLGVSANTPGGTD